MIRASAPAPWAMVFASLYLLVAMPLGCRSREDAFRATRVPVARLDSLLQAADSLRLPLAEARLLLGVVGDTAYAAKLPHDTMSITEILAWSRAEQVRKKQVDAAALAAAKARLDSLKQELAPLLAVSVVKKTFLPRDPASEQYEDYISLAFAYKNTGTKPIRAFQGDATFLDAFGDSIYSAHLKVDMAIAPGQTKR
ncbi:MAG TPA: hypothetical protein VJN39_06450, partial [Gemmatimonadales bacterium]|nr:hypothetical protein [Gemmatimonadales bacterium]